MNNRRNKERFPEPGHPSMSREKLTQHFREWRKTIGCYSIFAAVGTLMTGSPQEISAQDAAPNAASVPREADTLPRRRDVRPQFTQSRDQGSAPAAGALISAQAMTGSDDCPGTTIPSGAYTAASPYVDTGDTTGANNTVNQVVPYYSYNSHGPDRIYSFVVTSIGPDPEIKVTTTSPTYRPMIYLTDHPCPAGTGGTISDWSPGRRWYSTKFYDSRWGEGNTASVGYYHDWNYWDALYFGKRLYLFIDSSVAGDAGPYTLTIKDMTISSTPKVERHGRPDFDGDGLSDFGVFRPGDSTWYIKGSTQGFMSIPWGLPNDQLVPEDYDGDGRTDAAVYRDGAWHILGSSKGYIFVQWGSGADIPVPADFTGDGHSEIAIFRDGLWWIYDLSTDSSYVVNWGLAGDKPVPMDYDADGMADQAVVRDGTWHLYQSRLGPAGRQWGLASDKVVPGYFGSHNQADFSVYRNGSWYTLIQPFYWDVPTGVLSMQWGLSTDTPVAGNFIAVNAADAGVFRDGAWWMRTCAHHTCSGYIVHWGKTGDIPILAAYNR